MTICYTYFILCFTLTISCKDQFFLYKDSPKDALNISLWATSLLDQNNTQKEDRPISLELETASKKSVPVLFFNRQSDSVIIMGQGLGGSKEDMLFFAHLFHEYDIICFDYRWKSDPYFFLKPSNLIAPIQSILFDAQEEIVTVQNYSKKYKNYKETIGLGLCYSAALFIISQTEQLKKNNRLFTKLIVDSMWLSLKNFSQNRSLLSFLEYITPDYSLHTHISRITDTPILYIHGTEDAYIGLTVFHDIYFLTRNTPRLAFITPYDHSNSAYKNKAAYKDICRMFIDYSLEEIIACFS